LVKRPVIGPSTFVFEQSTRRLEHRCRTIISTFIKCNQPSLGAIMETDEEKLAYLTELALKRGYVLHQYGVLANYDLPVVKAIDGVTSEVYLKQRLLSRGVKELIFIISFTVQKLPVDNIANHVTMALENGISAQEILEAIEMLIPHVGIPTFSLALEAWTKATEAKEITVTLPERQGGLLSQTPVD
jgi:4-carboxymuconolactone decarboxylase